MCGIVGYTGKNQAVNFLVEGLKTLEYRGYDSAGVEVLSTDGELHGVKCAGRVAVLEERCKTANPVGTTGIAHTRWATHGAPTDENAHPHRDCSGRIAIVHNGIIENYRELRSYLSRNGHEFASDTDSEVIAHLIEDAWAGPAKGDLLTAVRNACRRLEGSWAIAAVCADVPGHDRGRPQRQPARCGLHARRRLLRLRRHAACQRDIPRHPARERPVRPPLPDRRGGGL